MSTDGTDKKKRVRSPAYPAYGLEDSIKRSRAIYEADDRHFAPLEAVASHWEYKTNNSAFLQYLSALKQFGLLIEEGSGDARKFRLTDRALDLLTYEEDHQKWKQAVKDAALEPKIHRELWEKYGGKLPREDVSIRVYLIRERQEGLFNKDHVDGFISQFRATIEFSKLSAADIIQQENGDNPNGESPEEEKSSGKKWMSAVVSQTHDHRKQTVREFPIPLLSGGIAVVKVPFPMTAADFTHLSNTLKAWQPALTFDAKDNGNSDPDDDDE